MGWIAGTRTHHAKHKIVGRIFFLHFLARDAYIVAGTSQHAIWHGTGACHGVLSQKRSTQIAIIQVTT